MPLSPEKSAQLAHEITVMLAQSLYEGWDFSTPAAHTSYNRPGERAYAPSGVVTQCGEIRLTREKYVTEGAERVVYGVDATITAAQYRRALMYLPVPYQQAIVGYLSSTPIAQEKYPYLTQIHVTAFRALADSLGLGIVQLNRVPIPPPEEKTVPPASVFDLFAPKRPRIRPQKKEVPDV